MRKNRIKDLRLQKGLSQSELAKKVGISNQVISFYENNKREPKIENWQKLADFFGVSVPYLQGIEPDFHEVTDETKKELVLILNGYYFKKRCEIEPTKERKIARKIADNLKIAVDKYLKLKKVSKYPSSFYSSKEKEFRLKTSIESYWLEHFNFLLNTHTLVFRINRVYFNACKHDVEPSTTGLAGFMLTIINQKIERDLTTLFGDYFEHLYLTDNNQKYKKFNQDLLTIETEKDLDKTFFEYINYLNELHKKLKDELVDDSLDKWKHKREERAKMIQEIKKYNEQST